ncbi:hypothetical protein BCR44DRAFT_1222609 [Catenaria anguillulae PL171]|uniref:Uncharacterized protein n=1 Tax=Catenaria anguillulae PL171 TaxID=765915 RepID=A0A1Y2HIM6_9FUNG|nr:hypothetical protein BCR44DRAFT_1222609 [Catenaria anguillulae PL171]
MVQGKVVPIQCQIDGIMNAASKCGRIAVLRWWKAHVLEPLLDTNRAAVEQDHYSTNAVDDASQEGHVECLDWWLKESELPIKFSSKAIKMAIVNMQHAVLDWWTRSGLDFKAKMRYESKASLTSTALKNKDLRGFQWLIDNDLAAFSDMTALCEIPDDPNLTIFHACAALVTAAPAALASSQSTLTRTHLPNPPAYVLATQAGRVDMLNHLRSMYKLPDRRTILGYLLVAAEKGYPHVLSWWIDKATALGILKFDTAISKLVHVAAAANGHINVLNWWSPRAAAAFPHILNAPPSASWTPGTKGKKSDMYILDFDAVNKAAANGHLNVLQWFWSWASQFSQPRAFGTIKKGYVCLNALKGGHADVIRWASTKRAFATIQSIRVLDAFAVAARNGYVEAMEAYVEGFCHVPVHVQVVGADTESTTTGTANEIVVGEEQVAWWMRIPELAGASEAWIMESLIQASSRGDLKTLNWWLGQPVTPRMSARNVEKAMSEASKSGHLDCLDWWCLAGSRMMQGGISQLAFAAASAFSSHAPVNEFVWDGGWRRHSDSLGAQSVFIQHLFDSDKCACGCVDEQLGQAGHGAL